MAPKKQPHARVPFNAPPRVEVDYARTLEDVFRDWVNFPAIDSIDQLFQRMNQLGNYEAARAIDRIALGMVTAVAHGNARSWREAATKATQGRRIYELLRVEMRGPVGAKARALVQENAKLIRTLPAHIAADVAKQIATRQMRGERPDAIAAEMMAKMPHIARSRIRLIARTEVAKASEAITRVRAEALGLNWYQWLTAEDIRVRESHKNMDLVLVNFNDPPSPEALVHEKNVGNYNAGNIYNCRCATAVIVDLGQVSWPARVYRNGSITRMSRAQFAKVAGAQVER